MEGKDSPKWSPGSASRTRWADWRSRSWGAPQVGRSAGVGRRCGVRGPGAWPGRRGRGQPTCSCRPGSAPAHSRHLGSPTMEEELGKMCCKENVMINFYVGLRTYVRVVTACLFFIKWRFVTNLTLWRRFFKEPQLDQYMFQLSF